MAVDRRIAQRLAVDRDQALAFLAGGFRDQLLGPGAEIGDLLRRQDGHLVAAVEAGEPHRQPELHARIFMRRHVRPAGTHHRKRVFDERADVDAGGGGGHQPERRQHGVAPADGGIAVEDARKTLFGRDLLQRRAGIGHRDETMPGLLGADRLGDAGEEIILHHVRLGGAAGFAGDDEDGVGEVDLRLQAAHLRRIGGIEHMQFREAGLLRKGLGQYFRPEARSAHAEHDGIAEILPFHAMGIILVIGDVGCGRTVEPAQPFVLVGSGPHRFVVLPEPSDFRRGSPLFGRALDRLADIAAEAERLPVEPCAEHGGALVRDRAVELVGGIREQLDAVLDQFGRDRIERDAGPFELGEDVSRVLDIFLEAVARLAVIAEGVERRRRHGVDRVGADQLLDIEHVAIVLVLGAGRGPQQPLRFCAPGRKLVPARPGKQLLVFLIGELRVGDGDLALQRGQPLLLAGIVGAGDLLVELLVDRAVDAADEEARDARDMGGIAAGLDVFFQSREICLGDLDIDLLREQQRDVDADAFADQMLDRGKAFRCRRHLHHQVLAADVIPEPLGLGDGALGIHREIRRDLQADKAVVAVELGHRPAAARRPRAGCPRPRPARTARPPERSPFFKALPIAPSYSSELPIAFSKIDGFEVTPLTPSVSINFCRSPLATKPRAKKSSQMA